MRRAPGTIYTGHLTGPWPRRDWDRLSDEACRVYLALASVAVPLTDYDPRYPAQVQMSMAELSDRTGLARIDAARGRLELERAGILRVWRGQGGTHEPNLYALRRGRHLQAVREAP